MVNNLEEIIKACESRYKIEFDNLPFYLVFLERQLRLHSEYDINYQPREYAEANKYPHLSILSDNLLLFSYLTGSTIIIAGYSSAEQEKRIESINDLYLLRPAELGNTSGYKTYVERIKRARLMITDTRLWRLYVTIRGRKLYLAKHYYINASNWRETIDELGKDEEVVRHFGQIISYEMVHKCHSPNPHVYDHGGNRQNKPSSLKILLEN